MFDMFDRGAAVISILMAAGGLVVPAPTLAQPAGFSLVTVATGLAEPTAFAFKGAEKILVAEKASGKVLLVRPDGSLRPTPYVTLSVSSDQERGVLGIAVDPNFETNGFVYVYYTTGPGALGYTGTPMNRVSRFTSVAGVGTSETILLDNIPSGTGIHNGGDIQFGFDGTLYVAVGDGGGPFRQYAQTLDTLRGKILRIKANGGVPVDNPYKHDPNGRRCGTPSGVPPGSGPCKEIYAYGFRNPFRFSLRPPNGSSIIADVGQNTWEELDSLVANGNYGWSVMEGPCPFTTNPDCDPSTTTYPAQYQYPIHFYHHSGDGETGETIIAGVFAEETGSYPPPYAGAYFYGDFSANWIHVLTMDAGNHVTGQFDFSTLNGPVAFRRGPDGNIYVLSYSDGALYKYVYTAP